MITINNIGEMTLYLINKGFLCIGKKGRKDIFQKGDFSFIIQEVKIK